MKPNYSIYVHINNQNGKKYIGQTKQKVEKRWNNGKGYKTSSKFYNAINKYGWDNFQHLIIADHLTNDQANCLEKQLINKYNLTDDHYGYNITNGGKNYCHSEETKRKIGLANSIALKGKSHSEEQNHKMSVLYTGEGNPFYGKRHTVESRIKMSNSKIGKQKGKDHPFYGKHHSIETKNKISNGRISKGGKKVKCINTGEIFNTMMDGARWCGLSNSSSIGQVCNKTGVQQTAGKHPETGEKLKWEFVE